MAKTTRRDTPAHPLREHRLQAGLTQSELAARAGVSRQLVAAVEAGQNAPAVDSAIRLASALGCTVEALFAPMSPEVTAALGGPLPESVPLRLGRVGELLVAAELSDHGVAGAVWASPDGVLEDGRLRLFPGAVPAGLVLAGCDPALGIAEAELRGLGASSLLALSAPTGVALRALAAGLVHGAVVHGPQGQLPTPPVPVAAFQLARWEVGVAAPQRLAGASFESLLGGQLPLVQRDESAASQQALRRAALAAEVDVLPGPLAGGHIDAARTAAMLGAAAVTTESAALAFGLDFLPLEEHTVQVWLARVWDGHPGASALFDLLASGAFVGRVSQLGGYDLTGCGERL